MMSAGSLFAQQTGATPGDFKLSSSDRVVLYGDSITDQRMYSTYIEEYVLTRFPEWNTTFIQSGVGGDKVSGGASGPIDERLQRDVLAYKPTVVTIMLGMNDGYYHAQNPAIEKTYQDGYRSMVDTLLKGDPGMRLTLLGPSPYDDVTHDSNHYNEVMEAYSRFDQQLAEEKHQSYTDLNAPVVAVLEKAKTAHPEIASELIPDRVHPGEGVHWSMAAAVLKGWNAPAMVSSVAIDGAAGKLTNSQRADVTLVARAKKGEEVLSWTEKEHSLPLPLPSAGADPVTDIALQAGGIEAALDQEMLTITNLPEAQYKLSIDGQPVDTFSSAQLAAGINLARRDTPMLRQSWLVALDTEHRNYLERRVYDANGSRTNFAQPLAPEKLAGREKAATDSAAQQKRDAQPVAHHFALSKAM